MEICFPASVNPVEEGIKFPPLLALAVSSMLRRGAGGGMSISVSLGPVFSLVWRLSTLDIGLYCTWRGFVFDLRFLAVSKQL